MPIDVTGEMYSDEEFSALLLAILTMPDMGSLPPRLRRGDTLHVLGFYSPEENYWIAQPLEIRYRGKGETFDEAVGELRKTLSEEPLAEMCLGGPADPKYAVLFYIAQIIGPIPSLVTREICYPDRSDYYDLMVHHWIYLGHRDW